MKIYENPAGWEMELLLWCSQMLPEQANYLKYYIMVKGPHQVLNSAASIKCINGKVCLKKLVSAPFTEIKFNACLIGS